MQIHVLPLMIISMLVLSSPVCGEDKLRLPTTEWPLQVIASLDKAGRVAIRMPQTSYRLKEETVKQDGKLETLQFYEAVVKEAVATFNVNDLLVLGIDGKEIDTKTLRERLKKEVPALYAVDGKKVDPLHLRIIKDGTLIFIPRKVIKAPDVPLPKIKK